MDTSDQELQQQMAARVRRHMLFSVLGVIGTLVALLIAWRGSESVFHGAVPHAFGWVYVGIFLIPVAVGVASARINMRCPACDAMARWLPGRRNCTACNRTIFRA